MLKKRISIVRRKAIEEPEIIVIPMIDVMMFLLFFFMVASLAMAVQSGLPVNLPKASTSKDQPTQQVTITLMADGRIFLNTAPTTLDSLKAKILSLHLAPTNLVIINADKGIPYGLVVSAM